ncbi:hypothetical protein [Shimia ponticola]|uniref:hypothetical protein n=1 Tax=Shimia ponticola TaxID=2582893 RepID=UPI0011BDE328|nr:hypothetical protein [Shimia ponticola]
MAVRKIPVPKDALLSRYIGRGHVDAFETDIGKEAPLQDCIGAFFGSWVFRIERRILAVAMKAPSSSADVASLARGEAKTIAVWHVIDRTENQLLMRVPDTPVRTWLAVSGTRLWFGSALVSETDRLPVTYRASLPFHALYSRLLLAAAMRKLQR